jgi:hypothetical protein
MSRATSRSQSSDALHTRRVRTLAGASFLLVSLAVGNWPTHAQAQSSFPSTDTRAVPTL